MKKLTITVLVALTISCQLAVAELKPSDLNGITRSPFIAEDGSCQAVTWGSKKDSPLTVQGSSNNDSHSFLAGIDLNNLPQRPKRSYAQWTLVSPTDRGLYATAGLTDVPVVDSSAGLEDIGFWSWAGDNKGKVAITTGLILLAGYAIYEAADSNKSSSRPQNSDQTTEGERSPNLNISADNGATVEVTIDSSNTEPSPEPAI